jgi:hypothetical protein
MLKKCFVGLFGAVALAIVCNAQTRSSSATTASSYSRSIHQVAPIVADVSMNSVNASGIQILGQQGHYYRSQDGRVSESLESGTVITDPKAGKITTLNPRTKQAIITSAPGPKGAYVKQKPLAFTPTITDLGTGSVEGHPVTMHRIANSSNNTTAEVWTATDIRLTVLTRMTGTSGQTTTKQHRNIQITEPDPSVFAIPSGYTITDKTSTATETATATSNQ